MKKILQTLGRRFLGADASTTFYGLFFFGALLAGSLAGGLVWYANQSVFKSFQEQTVAIEAESARDTLGLYIGDRRRNLEHYAAQTRVISAALGNSTAREYVSKLFRSFKFFSDQKRLALISVTEEAIVDVGGGADAQATDDVMRRLTRRLLDRPGAEAVVTTYDAEGRAIIAIATPVMRLGQTEGVLYGEFDYSSTHPIGAQETGFLLGARDAAGPSSSAALYPSPSWSETALPVDGADIVLSYFRNVDVLSQSRMAALLQTVGALLGGLLIAFAALAVVGRRLMLNPYRALLVSQDKLAKTNSALEHTSLHDALTGLPNRRSLDKLLAELAAPAAAGETKEYALLHIDLDRFKQINDTLGHAAGDFVLQHVSATLKRAVRASDFVGRIGGDEFVMVVRGVASPESVAQRADALIETLRQPIEFEGAECRFGASVGIALGRRGESNPKQLLIDADIALYRAKESGRGTFAHFTEADAVQVRDKKRLADEIHSALENKEFIPYYQPQVDALDGSLVGLEALARWRHPTRGVLAPDAFLDVAGDLGVLPDIDEQILIAGLEDRSDMILQGWRAPPLSVNVSSRRLADDNLMPKVEALSFEPGDLTFELLESTFLDQSDDVTHRNLTKLRALGIAFDIDDFGTGHASIRSLITLQPQRLKIDRQFVMPAVEDPTSRALISAMVDIANVLNIDVVAEGVESDAHATLMHDLGCGTLQGYGIARPMPYEALISWLMAHDTGAQAHLYPSFRAEGTRLAAR